MVARAPSLVLLPVAFLLASIWIGLDVVECCTTGVIGRGATLDGSTYVFGTADSEQGDFRVAKVESKVHEKSSDGGHGKRPVFALKQTYPHLVSKDRADTWKPENLEDLPQRSQWKLTEPIDSIPEVNHTYALIETGAGYAIANEHGLTFGESTCGARFVARPKFDGGSALFEVGQLMQIAMERAKTAREAIKLMGSLAEEHGYYGAMYDDPNEILRSSEAGESVTIADGVEGWVFHILPDDTGKSAIWAAQRVPEASYCIVANRFVIREIEEGSDDFLYSSNLKEVARRHGLWRPADGNLDFVKVYGFIDDPVYAADRIWGVARMWSPSTKLHRSHIDSFPVTFRSDVKIDLVHILQLLRDHYEQTDLDLTKGIAGGPFGDPDRYDKRPEPGVTSHDLEGRAFPRAISMFRTLVFHIQRSNARLPREVNARLLIGQHEPSDSTVIPVYVACKIVPPALSGGSLFAFKEESLYWQSTLIGNWVHKYYIHAHPYLKHLLETFESGLHAEMYQAEANAEQLTRMGNDSKAVELLQEFSLSSSTKVIDFMKASFLQGNPHAQQVEVYSMFYPRNWLETVGFLPPRAGERHVDFRSAEKIGEAASFKMRPYRQSASLGAVRSGLGLMTGVTVASVLCSVILLVQVVVLRKRRGHYQSLS